MARQARYTKQAVDQAAVEYWSTYFGPYGKQWTRDIARRVARVIAQGIQRAASKGESGAAPRILKAQIAPVGWAETATGGLTFEGVFRGTVVRGGRPTRVLRAFVAEFDARGKLTELTQLAA